MTTKDSRKGDRHKTLRKGDRHKKDELGRRVDRIIARENKAAMDPNPDWAKAKKETAKPKGKSATAGYLCVDGEALQDRYVYLACSDGRFIEHLPGLKTRQVFDFLLSLGVRELWGFGIGYDVNMWLIDLTKTDLERLAEKNKCYWYEYRIEHVPGKNFYLFERAKNKKGEWEVKRSIRLWDMWNFADSSFVELVKNWNLTEYPEEISWLQEMKEARAEFDERTYAAVKVYCNLELRLLHRGVDKLKALVEQEGFTPRFWHSPGSISAVAMRKNNVQEHLGRDDVPEDVKRLAGYAFFGGRFEVARVGLQGGPLYNYDLHSAYPAAAVDLPSLAGGTWEHVTGPDCVNLDDPGLFALVRCTWKPKKNPGKTLANRPDWGPFPWRIGQNSSSQYPLVSDEICYRWERYGWYWSCEVAAARFISRISLLEAWVFHPATSVKPLAYLKDLYQRRNELKAANDDREHVLKLILNATLGKLAQRPRTGVQSDGGGESTTPADPERKLPPFYCPIWAGWITAKTRARLLYELMWGDVIVLATDGFTSLKPHRIELGDGLGQWERKLLDWMFIVQAGFYFWPGRDKDGRSITVKHSRGIGKNQVAYESILDHWRQNGTKPLTFPQRLYIGYKSALSSGHLDHWRRWIEIDKQIALTMEPRRVDLPRDGDTMRSKPPLYGDRQRGLMDEILSMGANAHRELDALEWEQPDIPD